MSSGIRARTSSIHIPIAVIPLAATTPIQDLINGLTVDGVFAKFDRLWVFAQATEALALVDLVASATATTVNSPNFVANRGYTGEDAVNPTKYIDSGYNPVTSAVNYALNSAHVSAWSVGNVASVNGGVLTGLSDATDSANLAELVVTFTDGNIYARANDAAGSAGTPATRAGHWLINRNSSTTTQLYQNGALFASPNPTSQAVENANIYILARNHHGSGAEYGTPNQVAMVSMGGNLSATDASNFYTRLRTYMTAVGVP